MPIQADHTNSEKMSLRAGSVNIRQTSTRSSVPLETITDFQSMFRIRLTEEAIHSLWSVGAIVGSVHLSNGQEAIPVGVIGAREPQDAVFATYRGHGWALACGLPVVDLLAELCGRANGVNGGRGGSAYLSAPDYGFYGENSIVGAGAAMAVGAALAARYDNSRRVAIAVFGDGALNQGSVHESMNMASAFGLPVVFVCENNGYSELTRIDAMVKDPILSNRAAGYGIPGVRVDGNDPAAVRTVAAEAIARARAGGGPTLVEALTQRLVGHYIGDSETYRRPGELDAAREDEPLARLRRRFAEAGLTDAELLKLEYPVRDEVGRAVTKATAGPLADPATALEHLYG